MTVTTDAVSSSRSGAWDVRILLRDSFLAASEDIRPGASLCLPIAGSQAVAAVSTGRQVERCARRQPINTNHKIKKENESFDNINFSYYVGSTYHTVLLWLGIGRR